MTIKALLIDDSPEILQVLQIQYGLCPDMQVLGTASTVDEALEKVSCLPVDFVSLDIQLGTGNGLELCARIRRMLSGVFIVMCSMEADQMMQQAARTAGANLFLAKPVSIQDLNRVIEVFYTTSAQRRPTSTRAAEEWFDDLLNNLP